MGRDYVVKLFFKNGTDEKVKYESEELAIAAFLELEDAIDNKKERGGIILPDGTRFGFIVEQISHYKFFKFTASDR
jgi:hypothetical protein